MLWRLSRLFLRTLRDDPAEAEVASHKLLVRAGYIRRVAPGIYSWLPLGLAVLRNVEGIIREEMLAIGAQEVQLPTLIPRHIFEGSGRWADYGDALFRLQDRKSSEYLLGPTHEELFTLLVKGRIRVLQGFSGGLVPDPNEIPRRGPSSRRCTAGPGVRHEGLIFLRP